MGAKRSAAGFGCVVLATFWVLFVGASGVGAAGTDVTFDLTCGPSAVTPGDAWFCDGTFSNEGTSTLTHVSVTQETPGAAFDAAASDIDEVGSCDALAAGGVSCDFSNLPSGSDPISFTALFTTSPTSTGALANNAYLSFDNGASDPDVGRQDTVCANTYVKLDGATCAGAETTDLLSASERADQAGGYVAYVPNTVDTLATTGSSGVAGEVFTQLQIPFRSSDPDGFAATILEAVDPPGDQCPSGVACFGETVVENLVGNFAVTDPVVAEFLIVAPKGKNEKTIAVYHDGSLVGSCTSTPLSTTVDTCVVSRSQNKKTKLVTIVVQSTNNGSWDFS